MSAKVFQNIIAQMKPITDRTISILDSNGFIIASGNTAMIGTKSKDYSRFSPDENAGYLVTSENTYYNLPSATYHPDYVACVSGTDSTAKILAGMAAVAFNEGKSKYEEKHNKVAFIKSIISDNVLPGEVYVRAKELNFVADEPRSVLLIRQNEHADVSAFDLISNMFRDKQNDFVININETDVVLVKRLEKSDDTELVLSYAEKIEKNLKKELGISCVIGISTESHHLRELADRFKEAQVAIEVGKVFESDKTIVLYERLGLGRIIYQLPTTLCEMFLREVFKKNPIETLDEDTISTINKFFENNLNVSETSRKLYVHRNTLVYRLEKIKKITGLDLREFDHAIVFKVAMMVKMYLDSIAQPKR